MCRQIIEERGYDNVDPVNIASTLEGLYDGLWLDILMYSGVFSRSDMMKRIKDYLAPVFPKHLQCSPAPAGKG